MQKAIPNLSIIVATDNNNGIGLNNTLPWHLPEDLKYFKALTLGKIVLMGRKTFESIGRPLPGRVNVILTRNKSYQADGCVVINDLDQLFDIKQINKEVAAIQDFAQQEIFCIGGANLYKQLLDKASVLYLTKVDTVLNADAFFPKINWNNWQEDLTNPIKSYLKDDKHKFNFSFHKYNRII